MLRIRKESITKNAFFPHLDQDAPEVPKGLRPRPGVEYGCGQKKCRDCYEVIPRFELRPSDLGCFRLTDR